mmetsp:Transcript_11183/g.22271  ORF Transcript_11183/g.22271 Transcript_11183/m.22271 type:complete len:214 (-) Transcript_11183:2479-3120(-)
MSEGCQESRLDIRPSAHILALLLAPDHLSGRVFLGVSSDEIERKRRYLFEANNCEIIDFPSPTFCVQVVEHLSGAEDQFPDILVRDEILGGIVECFEKVLSFVHFRQTALAQRVSQKRFRSHHNKRLPKITTKLPPQQVKIVCRCAWIRHLPVALLYLSRCLGVHVGYSIRVIATHLKEPFQSRGGMFWALSFVAVGKQHGEGRLTTPFHLTR